MSHFSDTSSHYELPDCYNNITNYPYDPYNKDIPYKKDIASWVDESDNDAGAITLDAVAERISRTGESNDKSIGFPIVFVV